MATVSAAVASRPSRDPIEKASSIIASLAVRAGMAIFCRAASTGAAKKEPVKRIAAAPRSEEHTSELQSLMRISYAVFCLKNKKQTNNTTLLITHIITPQLQTQ